MQGAVCAGFGVGRIDWTLSSYFLLPPVREKDYGEPMRNETSIRRAKRNRADPTSAEGTLWRMLRGRRYREAKFRRQHAIGPYVVDFACVRLRLVIEVDGPSHDYAEQAAFDATRTADLERWGWRVARIANADVFAGGDGLYEFLDRAMKS